MEDVKEMVTVSVPKELYEYVKKLSSLMNSQDNRATRQPIYYTIRYTDKLTCSEDSDMFVYLDSDDPDIEYENIEEARTSHKEDGYEGEDLENKIMELTQWYYQHVTRHKNVFLTEEACHLHMKQNKHHAGYKEHSYVSHAWRNPEMEKVFELIHEVGSSHDTE